MLEEEEEIELEVPETKEKKCQEKEKMKIDEKVTEGIGWVFVIFTIIWTFMIAINRFYDIAAWPILLIPYLVMGIGFLNKEEIADDKIEEGVFSTTFISMGLIFAFPLLGYINNKIFGAESKDENSKNDPKKKAMVSQLNHIIFLAMIMTLLSYIHIWVDESMRHIFKIVRSCFETIAVTLYIYALTIFFMLT